MNILIVNHYAGTPDSGGTPRHFYLGREWVKLGHSVTILAASNHHLRRYPAPSVRENLDGVNFEWIPTSPYSGNGVGRVRNMLQFAWRLSKYRAGSELFDIVIASSPHPLSVYNAFRLSKSNESQFIFEVRDIWPLSLIQLLGLRKINPLVILLKHAELFAVRNSHKIVSVLPGSERYFSSFSDHNGNYECIPNGVDVDGWIIDKSAIPQSISSKLESLKNQGNFIVGYTGSHGKPNSLENLIKSAKILRDKPISFVLIGSGNNKHELINLANSMNLDNLFFFDPVRKSAIPALMAEMDALYIGLQDKSVFEFGVSPNKLSEYMLAGKPIIYGIRDRVDLVSENKCGITVEPDNPDDAAKAIYKLSTMKKTDLINMGRRGQNYIKLNRSYSALANRYLIYMEAPRIL